MEPIVIGIVALIGGIIALIGVFVFGLKSGANEVSASITSQFEKTQAIDRANYLFTLRRELANILVWHNPQRYLQLYRQIHSDVSSLGSKRPEEVHTRLAELSKKYPFYNDFDWVATKEYVLYADSVSTKDPELEIHYCDLVMFAALSAIVDEAWKDAASKAFVHTTNDKELAHLIRYVQQIEDTKLMLRIERAMDDNYMQRMDDQRNLDNDFYTIIDLPHIAENRYGVHLKRTNEFGIYSFFTYDDGRTTDSFYRTDPTFETEQRLDYLPGVQEEAKLDRQVLNNLASNIDL